MTQALPWILGTITVVFWLGFAFALWRHFRRQPPAAPAPQVAIYEEAPILPANQPWSPTRGTYTFKVADLPAVYRELASLAGRELVSQLAEDEEDARRALTVRLMGDYGRERNRGTHELVRAHELVTAAPIAFKALTRRKGGRT